VDELADSAALLSDAGALRRRLAEDGYLFFRNLLPAAQVRAAAAGVLAELRRVGWVDDRGTPSADRRALNSMEALGDPAFRAAIASPAFNRVPYLAPLRGLVRQILGPGAFSYPAKVLRAVYPERPPGTARGRYVHQDYAVSACRTCARPWSNAIPAGRTSEHSGTPPDQPSRARTASGLSAVRSSAWSCQRPG
jgi:hypothetical protein